jgi:hypothetical protein
MELNNLLNESAQGYKSLQADAARLAEKWSATGLLEGLGNEGEKNSMAMILENQAKQVISEANATNANGGAEQWAGVALPLVRKVFAQIAAKDFVSVQPMNLPSGLVFYLDFKYGSGLRAAENMYGTVSTAGDKMTAADGDATGGLYGAGKFGYSANDIVAALAAAGVADAAPIALSRVDYSDAVTLASYAEVTGSFPAGADVEGVRAFAPLSSSAAVAHLPEYTRVIANGTKISFVVPAAKAADIDGISYHLQPTESTRGDFEFAAGVADAAAGTGGAIPEINVSLASESIVAKTRKLKAQWSPEFAQDLNAYHSVDAEAELTSILSEYISMEIDLEILDMLMLDAATVDYWSAENNVVWNGSAFAGASADFYNTQGQWFQTLGTKIQKVSNKIHQKTLRGGANFLVCSPSVATILESIPGYAADTNGDKMDFAMGVQKVGQLNSRYRVYKNPYMTENTILMGYRGSQFLETGAVYAPYIPLMMTPLVYDPANFTPTKGIMTRYAKKMIRPEFYGKIFVNGLATI